MNITKILFFATALAMLLISCEKENIFEAETATGRINEVCYTSVYLEDPTAIITKGEENKIYDISFFIFDADGARDSQNGYQAFQYTGRQYTFLVTPGENKTIIAVANLKHLGDLGGADLDTVQQILRKTMAPRPAEISEVGVAMAAEKNGIQFLITKGEVQIIKMMLSETLYQ